MMQRLWKVVKAPLQAGLITASGDTCCQMQLEGKSFRDLDKRRTLAFATFGFFYGGFVNHLVYNRIFAQLFGAGTGWRTVASKTAADAFITAPFLYVPTFYLSTGVMQGSTVTESWLKCQSKWTETMKAYLCIWPATLSVAFSVIPVQHRVVYIACVAFVEKAIFSAISNDSIEP